MPNLDVSEALLDPDFATQITVIRRPETVSDGGMSQVTPVTYANVVAIVTAGEGEVLVREPDYQLGGVGIVVHTKFLLRGPGLGFQPDQIVWLGKTYTIKGARNWSQFGTGWNSAKIALDPGVGAGEE